MTFFRAFTWDSVGGKRSVWPYIGSPYPPGSYDVSTWAAVAAERPIKLNFGGGTDKHPRTNFAGYVAVEALNREAETMGTVYRRVGKNIAGGPRRHSSKYVHRRGDGPTRMASAGSQ